MKRIDVLVSVLGLTFSVGACGKVDPALVGGAADAASAPASDAAIPAPAPTTAATDAAGEPTPSEADAGAKPAPDIGAIAARARLAERREVMVDCVWFRGPEGPTASGGTSPVTVRIEPNNKPEASVGVIEEYAGGAGEMWRASAWMAAFNASETLGYMLTDHEFLVKTGGHIDGPSAGMLTTAAMIAVLTDTPVREDSTMSGTINPDGSAGPVGGLPQKMEGAKAKGKTRFGYPVGCRNSKDLKTGQMADLEVLGRDLGMEVKEINDIREAYEFMTGKELPPLTLAAETDMQLDPDLRQRVKAKLMSWQADLAGRLPGLDQRIKKMRQEIKNYVLPIFGDLQKNITEADNFERSGLEVPAYNRYLLVAMMFRMAMETVDVLEAMQKGDYAKVEERIGALAAVEGKVKALELELGVNARKKTLGGIINSVAGFAYFNITRAFMDLGKFHYNRAHQIMEAIKANKIPANEQAINQMVADLLKPVMYFAAADAIIQAGRESMDFAPEQGTDVQLDAGKLLKLAKAYGSAASAGIAYFDSTVVKPEAEGAGVSFEQAASFFQNEDGNYLLAPILSQTAGFAEHITGGEKPETAMIRLSAGVMAFIQSAGLINKYYSLGYQKQQDGSAVLTQRRALSSQLDLSKRAALAAAGEAKKALGFIPATAKLSFENANALREGDDADKLDALNDYWQSAFWSRLALTIARR